MGVYIKIPYMNVSIGIGRKNSPISVVIISVFLIILGVLFVVLIGNEVNRMANWVETTAVIKNIIPTRQGDSIRYEVFVDYSYNGKDYLDQALNSYESSMYVGQIILIRVNPKAPGQFTYGNMGFYNTFMIVGRCLIGFGCGLPICFFGYRYYKKKKQNNNTPDDKNTPNNNEKPKKKLFKKEQAPKDDNLPDYFK